MARPGFGDHPKCINLEARLIEILPPKMRPLAPALARGVMELLWEVAYNNGDAVIGHAATVERIAGWAFEPGALARILSTCGRAGQAGLLEEIEPDVFAVHDLLDHAPEYVARRLAREAARRQKGMSLREVRRDAGRKGYEAMIARQTEIFAGQTPPPAGQVADTCPPLGGPVVRHVSASPAPAPAPAPGREEEDGSFGSGAAAGAARRRPSASAQEIEAIEVWCRSVNLEPCAPARLARLRKMAGGAAQLRAFLGDQLRDGNLPRGWDFLQKALEGTVRRNGQAWSHAGDLLAPPPVAPLSAMVSQAAAFEERLREKRRERQAQIEADRAAAEVTDAG